MRHTAILLASFLTSVTLFGSRAEAAPPESGRIEVYAQAATVRFPVERGRARKTSAKIESARNEVESFQLIITARENQLHEVMVETDGLNSDGGEHITRKDFAFFRVVGIPVRQSSPHAALPKGMFPDALVPFTDAITGDAIPASRWISSREQLPGAQFGGAPIRAIPPGGSETIWVDIRVPADASPGVYTGSLRITAANAVEARLPVQLEVWDFTLPDAPTHTNHFGGMIHGARHLGLAPGSDEYNRMESRLADLFYEHRLTPRLPRRLQPPPEPDGAVLFPKEIERGIDAFVGKYRIKNLEVPRAPFRDNQTEEIAHFYRSWYAFLERKELNEESFVYLYDEPNSKEAYDKVRAQAAVVHAAVPALRCLVVEQTYTQDPEWGTLIGAVDIWCPLFGFVDEETIGEALQRGEQVWSYTALVQPAPEYHPHAAELKGKYPPIWLIDFPVTAYRVAPWLNRRYNINGLLYWATTYWSPRERNPWNDPALRLVWNGEGALFYPGAAIGIDDIVPTIRLKMLRDGMEDYEYFALLDKAGKGEQVERAVRKVAPSWHQWRQAPRTILKIRRKLAKAILRLQ